MRAFPRLCLLRPLLVRKPISARRISAGGIRHVVYSVNIYHAGILDATAVGVVFVNVEYRLVALTNKIITVVAYGKPQPYIMFNFIAACPINHDKLIRLVVKDNGGI